MTVSRAHPANSEEANGVYEELACRELGGSGRLLSGAVELRAGPTRGQQLARVNSTSRASRRGERASLHSCKTGRAASAARNAMRPPRRSAMPKRPVPARWWARLGLLLLEDVQHLAGLRPPWMAMRAGAAGARAEALRAISGLGLVTRGAVNGTVARGHCVCTM